ncbi:hypothetical protein BC937DRAFT_94026 [Endogone sp. FLAS-F59071]|nr:hypothetical protein BC937DRAFT_94026 [Endogone sp. FLAS-F59071]|eukprot:RUS20920.1 hypothetical protein BC937DRAFT_94026 [Endogone sp. FLAS-F59071]
MKYPYDLAQSLHIREAFSLEVGQAIRLVPPSREHVERDLPANRHNKSFDERGEQESECHQHQRGRWCRDVHGR